MDNDLVVGGLGVDTVYGQDGVDTVTGGNGTGFEDGNTVVTPAAEIMNVLSLNFDWIDVI